MRPEKGRIEMTMDDAYPNMIHQHREERTVIAITDDEEEGC
jgi:hypothetical protein